LLNILIIIIVCMVSYLFGCQSTSRFVARTYRNLNLDKIGSGLADTENIYTNVDKMLGILVGAIDVAKIYVYLLVLRFILGLFAENLTQTNHMVLFGIFVLVGHCLPLTHHLRGGRGIFTYLGLVAFFAWMPMLLGAVVAFLVIFGFKQIRFGQYMIVLLPPFFNLAINSLVPHTYSALTSISTFPLVIIALIMGALNILVSKKLGEI
jgi:acyl phosphate:glycerol-3-phosphate acyltransferase